MTGPLPRLVVWLVCRSVHAALAEDVLGELEARWRAERSALRAIWQVATVALAVVWHARRERGPSTSGQLPPRILESLATDVDFAWRALVRRPRVSVAAILTLALGLGASIAILTGARTVLARSLPYPDSGRLVHLWASWPGGFGNLAYLDVDAIRTSVPALDDVAAYEGWGTVTLGAGDRPINVTPTFVSERYLPILGATVAAGRLFDAADQRPGAQAVVILSEGFWRRAYAADPLVVGTSVTLNGAPYRIVGVVRNPFPSLGEFYHPPTDIWLPAVAAEPLLGQAPLTQVVRLFWGVGHLAPGASIAQLRQQLDAVAARTAAIRPSTHRGYRLEAKPLADFLLGAVTRPAELLVVGSLLMLVVSCANATNLLLASGFERRGEYGVRQALGASRARLLRQSLAESAILVASGAALGCVCAVVLTGALERFVLLHVSAFIDLPSSWAALATAGVLGGLTAIGVGAGPALAASNGDVARAASLAGRSGAMASRHRLRSALVVVEVAVAAVLLVGVGLLARSFERLSTSGLGFSTERLLTFRLDLAGARYGSDVARVHFAQTVVQATESLPEVESATIWGPSMLGRATWVVSVLPEGRPADRPEAFTLAFYHLTSPGGLHNLRISLVGGREFTPFDTASAVPVAVISEALVREWWGGDVSRALGARLQRPDATLPLLTVVGVARDARHRDRYSLQDIADGLSPLGLSPQRDVYLPYAQRAPHDLTLAIRVGNPSAAVAPIRAAVRRLDPALAVDDVRTLDERLAEQGQGLGAIVGLMGAYAVLAVVLVGVGLYSVLAHSVRERTREIGIRLALGARPARLLATVLRQSGRLILSGAVLGLVVAESLARLLRTLLYGVAPGDRYTMAATVLFLTALGLTALWLPARRATRIDPVTALRAP